jgi:L-asparaginase II
MMSSSSVAPPPSKIQGETLPQRLQQLNHHHLVANAYRGTILEQSHTAHWCLLGASGQVLASSTGGEAWQASWRSAAKPLQAWAALSQVEPSAWVTLPPEALAVACGSHSGLLAHHVAVDHWLQQAGLGHEQLACGVHPPLASQTHQPNTAKANNCSGKHALQVWVCVQRHWPTGTYTLPKHVLQQAIAQQLQGLCPQHPLHWSTDGCGLPVPASSLLGLAQAVQQWTADPVGQRLWQAMRTHPYYLGGPNRLDTVLAMASPLLSKTGAEGLVWVWHPAHNEVLVLKTTSGDCAARDRLVVWLLQQLGWLTPPMALRCQAQLLSLQTQRRNHHGEGIGVWECSKTR